MFSTVSYEMKVKRLLQAFYSNENLPLILSLFKDDSLIKIHEIGQALYMLLAFHCGQEKVSDCLQLNVTTRQTVCLFKRANFIWDALPYPKEYAELGALCMQLATYDDKYKKIAKNMLAFQQASFTHNQEIFSSLFTQNFSRNYKDINSAGHIFLSAMNTSCEEEYFFNDDELGFLMWREKNFSAYISGSGCKSSLGAFLFQDIGIVAWGPHQGIPENGEGFGLSGRPLYFRSYKNNRCAKIAYSTCLSAPSERFTGFQFLKDSQLSLSRVKVAVEMTVACYGIDIEFINCQKENSYFAIFCKAHVCSIVKGPRLRAHSLDSYHGPISTVILEGINQEKLKIEGIRGEEMQIFSLPGNNTFWEANFLMLFKRNYDKIECYFTL